MMEEIILPNKIFLNEVDKNKNEAVITIEPCHPRYGVTLGNALRRVLLSSLPGAAVTAIKIKGVDHEFSTIDHIKESVIDIILNLKSLRLKLFTDEPVRLKLISKGKKIIRAADIEKNSNVEIVNPDLKIAEATDEKAELEMDIIVEKGRGYVPTEQKESKDLEIGMIVVDSIFMPVLSVGYEVENMRVGQRTDYERLKMRIKTDGTITPLEALSESAKILVSQFSTLSDNKKLLEKIKATAMEKKVEKETKTIKKEEKPEDKSITELNFSTRTFNALDRAKIRKITDLISHSEAELLELPGFGQTALEEVKKALKKLNLELKK